MNINDKTKEDSLNRELFFSPRATSGKTESPPNIGRIPADDTQDIAFEDLFNLDDIQRLQDEFARATGVASMIMRPDGVPITKPSNFCRLCFDIIRKTDKGYKMCVESDATFGRPNSAGPTIALCKSVGLWDAGATIIVQGKHIANWMIGQVRDECQSEQQIRLFARHIGADEEEMVKAFLEVPTMSQEQFRHVAQVLFTLANQLSTFAFQNVQQARILAERRRAEDALRESEETFRALTEQNPDVIMRFDKQHRHLYVNPVVETQTGIKPNVFIGKTHHELGFPKDLVELWEHAIDKVITTAKPNRIEFQLPSGSWIDWLLTPEFSPGGEVNAVITSARDITERKQSEQEKDKLEEQLRQAQKMEAVGRLAGGIAHDFNNILTGINGYAALILNSLDPVDPLRADIQEIKTAGERATALTAQLLAFSRKQVISPKVVQPNEILERSQKMLRRIIGEDIELKFIPVADLGRIKVDPVQLDQVLVNLVVNARDAMPNGGKLTIEMQNASLDREFCDLHVDSQIGEYVMLAVTDSGCGMDEETKSKVFEPFFSTKTKSKGTGLGLATVYGIVKQNNGFISVYSELNAFTTFKVYFPRVMAKADPLKIGRASCRERVYHPV